MTATEFGFLALGLLLGGASGVALIEVLRARPPVRREVRVTVAPNAIQGRMSATLSEAHTAAVDIGPARGGPGDRRWRDEVVTNGEPATTGRRVDHPGDAGRVVAGRSGTSVRSAPDVAPHPGAATAAGRPDALPPAPMARPAPTSAPSLHQSPVWLSPAAAIAGPGSVLAPVPMSIEPDPITLALRATAAAIAVGKMASSSGTAASSSVAIAELPESRSADEGDAAASTSFASAASGAVESSPAADGPCIEERRVADERCVVATRARDGAAAAADSLRRSQHTRDDLAARAESAAAAADPRAVRVAKELAQRRFHDVRAAAQTRDDVEAGAREWLEEINRINHETREATLVIERDRSTAAAMERDLERLALEADAARILAEQADEACLAAREALAACDEARNLAEAAARSGGAEADGDDAGDPDGSRIAAATPEPEDEFAFATPMRSQAGAEAVILQILRGDREAMQRAVARLAGDDPEAHRRWQVLLGSLAEALIARSIEASAFEFPLVHPFWGPFSQSQNRDIAAGLSSLGFRFDGFGGWVDDRVPSQRDLSLAVGYAGLDPMRVRHWPSEAESRELLRDVRVAADEYVASAAGGMTLGELVSVLGRRADGLTELWNHWGTVRPILLEAS